MAPGAVPGAGIPSASLTPMGSHAIPRHPVNGPRLRAVAAEPRSRGRGGFARRGRLWIASCRISPIASTPRAASRSRRRSGRFWRRTASRASTPIRRSISRRSTAGALKLLAEIDALLATMPSWSPARDAFATALLGTSEILRMDAEGRVSLDERLKAALGLGDEAVFVGQGHKFQIWEPSRFQAHLEESRLRVRTAQSRARRRGDAGMSEARAAPHSRPAGRGPRGAPAARGRPHRRRHFRRRRLCASAARLAAPR